MLSTWKQISAAALAVVFAGSFALVAQEPNPTQVVPGARQGEVLAQGPNGTYIYHVHVIERSLDGVNYINRNGRTHIGFVGTNLMPNARGEAIVEFRNG